MKLIKRIYKGTLVLCIALVLPLAAFIAVLSMSNSLNTFTAPIAKTGIITTRKNDDATILQSPVEKTKWAKRLVHDMNVFHEPPQLASLGNFTFQTNNTNAVVAKYVTTTITGTVTWGGSAQGTSSGSACLKGIDVSFSGSGTSGANLSSRILSNVVASGRQNFGRSSSITKTFQISGKTTFNSPSMSGHITQIKINPRMYYTGVRMNGIKTSITHIKVAPNIGLIWDWNVNWEHTLDTRKNSPGHEAKLSEGNGTGMSTYIGKPFVTEQRQLKYKKLYMPYFVSHNSQLRSKELIKPYIHIFNGTTEIPQSRVSFETLAFNKTTNIITGMVNIAGPNSGQRYYRKQISIPVINISITKLVKASTMSSPFWEHMQNGMTRYHSVAPSTDLTLSENYIKALYFTSNKNKYIKKLDESDWGFVGSDKQLAVSKIEALELNEENYSSVKNAYKKAHSKEVFENLQTQDELKAMDHINHFNAGCLQYYLYVLSKTTFNFHFALNPIYGVDNKTVSLTDLSNTVHVKLPPSLVRAQSPYRTTWTISIMNLQATCSVAPAMHHMLLSFDLDKGNLKRLYDLDLHYENSGGYDNLTIIQHTYLYQTHGIDISNDISFVMEDGSVLDQDFKVVRVGSGSKLSLNSYAYINIRYWTTFSSGTKEYVTVTKKGNRWWSPRYSKYIDQMDSSFSEAKLEYLFNQCLQLIVNPYQHSAGTKITSATPQKFGLSEVSDIKNGNKKILESWEDGKWSHSSAQTGNAIFDGVFGTDINGIFDQYGRLSEGTHNINIKLKHSALTGLKQNFHITIDKNPVKVKVNSVSKEVKELVIEDKDGSSQLLYYSSGPINFVVNEVDIASIDAQFLDSVGNWYSLPIDIRSKQIKNKWKQVIDSTIDYAGFAKIIITDQAGNKRRLYFWLKQSEASELPKYIFDKTLVRVGQTGNVKLDETPRVFKNDKLSILNYDLPLIVSNPLAKSIEIEREVLHEGIYKPSTTGFTIADEVPFYNQYSLAFGKTIDSSQGVLKYAGDELKPFLKTPVAGDKWPVLNKRINFDQGGLYKLTFNTRFEEKKIVEEYIYIKDTSLEVVDMANATKDETNLIELPKLDKGPKNGIDKSIDCLEKINIDIPMFLVKDWNVSYSLPWYSEFTPLKDKQQAFEREGKYKIKINDIYGQEHNMSVLLLKKSLTTEKRTASGLSMIYTDEAKPDTAFWKGKNVWSYWRYEDEDHAIWEHKAFIDKAMKNGLTKEQAEWLFKQMKRDPNFDGGKTLLEKQFDFKKQLAAEAEKERLRKQKEQALNFKHKKKGISGGALTGIIIGSSIFGVIGLGGAIWVISKRMKGKAIR